MNKSIIVFIALFITLDYLSLAQSSNKKSFLSVHQTSQSLRKDISMRIEADVLYDLSQKDFIFHFGYPINYYQLTNQFGEIKIYYPERNEFIIKQSDDFGKNSNLIELLANHQTHDMGLKSLGFKLTNSTISDGYLVSEWEKAVESIVNNVFRVKIVYDNELPIYTEYFSVDSKTIKKIYYGGYFHLEEFSIPRIVTEIEYHSSPNDSTINRMKYSSIEIVGSDHHLCNFKIPENAKPFTEN